MIWCHLPKLVLFPVPFPQDHSWVLQEQIIMYQDWANYVLFLERGIDGTSAKVTAASFI